jgi:phage-related protein
MKWAITFYKGVGEKILQDWPIGIRAKFAWLTRLLQTHGPNDIGMPHIKALGQGLFEIRVHGKEGIGRAFFCLFNDRQIFVLHAFIKKTQKIPTKELDLALKRLKELKK